MPLTAWRLALRVSIPVTIGTAFGAGLAEVLPGRDLGLMITAAILVALILLFTKLKHAIESVQVGELRFGIREWLWFLLIGVWLGFIVIDGATYLLLALVLAVGMSPRRCSHASRVASTTRISFRCTGSTA